MDILRLKKCIESLKVSEIVVFDYEDNKTINKLINKYESVLKSGNELLSVKDISVNERGRCKIGIKSYLKLVYLKPLSNRLDDYKEAYSQIKKQSLFSNHKCFLLDVEDSCDNSFEDGCDCCFYENEERWKSHGLIDKKHDYLKSVLFFNIDKTFFSELIYSSHTSRKRSGIKMDSPLDLALKDTIQTQILKEFQEQNPNIEQILQDKFNNYETSK